MRLRAFVDWPRVIEPFSLLSVFLKTNLIFEGQIIASRHVEDRTTNVCIALPEATNNPINVIDLKEVIEIEICDIFKYGLVMNVPLKQLNLDSLRVIIVLINLDEAFSDLVGY